MHTAQNRNAQIQRALADALAERHLLTHPFYQRWEAGGLAQSELAAYAEQYRLIERELPLTLAAIASQLDEGPARSLVEANLADELGEPAPHLALFESFAEASGARPNVASTEATADLLAAVRAVSSSDPVAALSMVAAYEVQAADIAASKADGLRRHYGMDADARRVSGTSTPSKRPPMPTGRSRPSPSSTPTRLPCWPQPRWRPKPGGRSSMSARPWRPRPPPPERALTGRFSP